MACEIEIRNIKRDLIKNDSDEGVVELLLEINNGKTEYFNYEYTHGKINSNSDNTIIEFERRPHKDYIHTEEFFGELELRRDGKIVSVIDGEIRTINLTDDIGVRFFFSGTERSKESMTMEIRHKLVEKSE